MKALTSRSKRPFTMDEVLPVRAADGLDVPSYQAYLVVAWLRAIGAVERIGNDGYTARADRLAPSEIDKLWADLKTQHGATTDVA